MVFQMPLASKGPLQLIYCQCYKGVVGARGTMLLILHREKGKERTVTELPLPKSPNRQEDRDTEGKVATQ